MKEAGAKLESKFKQAENKLKTATKSGQAKVVKALDSASQAIAAPQLEMAATKPAVTKNLDDLIREYGMEQEAAFVDSGDW